MIHQIKINSFSEYIVVAANTKAKYYKEGNVRIPKKYQGVNFVFKNKKLFNTETQVFVASNANQIGKPRSIKVNGQDLYNGRMHHKTRAKVAAMLHEYFSPYVKQVDLITKYPVEITMSFHIHDMGKNNIDNDNKWLWQKAFTDTLVQEGIIKDDSPYFVVSHRLITTLIPEEQEQQLYITIKDGA